jgi:hypothetical protein
VVGAAMSTRRRRTAAGGCVTCRFQCQHAMTGAPGQPWPVRTAVREQARPVRHAGPVPGRPAAAGHPVPRALLPIQPVAPRSVRDEKALDLVPAGSVPRWPDRPAYRAADLSGAARQCR